MFGVKNCEDGFVAPKCRYLYTKEYGVTSQRTGLLIVTAVWASHLI
jgi:hypothetical protein